MSTLSDEIGGVMREFGMPLLDALTPVLKGMIGLVHQMVPYVKWIAEMFAGILKKMAAMLGFKPVVPGVRAKGDPDAQKEALKGGVDEKKKDKPHIGVGHMRELGGGGAFHLGLGSRSDPLLAETRRTNNLLAKIAANTAGGNKEKPQRMPVPVAL